MTFRNRCLIMLAVTGVLTLASCVTLVRVETRRGVLAIGGGALILIYNPIPASSPPWQPGLHWSPWADTAFGGRFAGMPAYINAGPDVLLSCPLWLLMLVSIGVLALCSRKTREPTEHACQHCGYDLTGNVSGRCPECGTELRGVNL